MLLRPQSFSIPSSTQLKVTFTLNLSNNLTVSNFKVESLNGAVDDLVILGLEITDNILILKTRPQVSGNYYLLRFLDNGNNIFESNTGIRLVDDSVSRSLFFIGIDTVNPIRDRIYLKTPNIISLDNSNIKNILSSQAEELYRAQKSIGELLSDNYISIDVTDEVRVRTTGAFDRFANENVYKLDRVSKNPAKNILIYETLNYTDSNLYTKHSKLPFYPVSLQETLVEDEEISISTTGNSFEGFKVSVNNKNIIKLLYLKVVKDSDTEDCNGNIGTIYSIDKYKYAIKDNFYDQEYGFSKPTLENNQIEISEFGNIDYLEPSDTIYISYLYKDLSKLINTDSILVSRVESIVNEPIPTNASRFFLKHAPIINSSNVIIDRSGLTFKTSENDDTIPAEFKKEIVFNFSKLPSIPGEYSVNYETGEVYVVGTSDSIGTGQNAYVVSYLYRKEFKNNLDYFISDNNLSAIKNRDLINKDIEISFNYESVYVDGIDYKFNSHIEVSAEQVENRLKSSFSLETKNYPITNVYRILNQTTGEVYQFLYQTDTEIFFSGRRAPEIKTNYKEISNFKKINNETLKVTGEFIIPTFEVTITSIASKNAIQFSPSIPADLIDYNSTDYFYRETTTSDNSISVEDTQIKLFGTADSNNLINTLAINSSASLPTLNSKVFIGPKGFIVSLDNTNILNYELNKLGSFTNTSIAFSNSDLFISEKYFQPFTVTDGFNNTTNDNLTVAINFDKTEILYSNLSRLRKVGDYTVDYGHGTIYLAVKTDANFNLGFISYQSAEHISNNENVLSILDIKKLLNVSSQTSELTYKGAITNTSISPINLEDNYVQFDNSTEAADLNQERQLICLVLEDYTAVVPYNIYSIRSINTLSQFIGENLTSSIYSNRIPEKSSADILDSFNIYQSYVSFSKNVIDLKKKVKVRTSLNSDNSYSINLNSTDAKNFYSAERIRASGYTYFTSNLNINKSSVKIIAADTSNVYINIDDISNIIVGNYLLDKNLNRFKIIDIDTNLSILSIESPAENNSESTSPALDSTGSDSYIITRAHTDISNGNLIITIPEDANLISGELFEITYLTDKTPDIDTALIIDYNYGDIYFDYNYIYDQVAVWYEYGDNSIDWSISNTLSEGEQYYVSYKYGANRNALRRNFGTLTQIPFFQNFALDINRELYRNALKGVLQTFPKGPVINSYKELIKSFTDINPNISESNNDFWILGRDPWNTNKVNFSGNLNFKNGRIESGLYFDNQTTVSIPSISNISLKEGTLECNIIPDWAGINNDAKLTFYINHIGNEKIKLLSNMNPFNNGWNTLPINNLNGIIDTEGLGSRVSNFKQSEDKIEVGPAGIFYSLSSFNVTTPIEYKAKVKINNFGQHLNRSQSKLSSKNEFTLGNLVTYDLNKFSGISFNLSLLKVDGQELYLYSSELEYDDIPSFDGPYITRNCNCTVDNNISTFENINNLELTITLDETVSLDYFKNNVELIDSSANIFILTDKYGDAYQVTGFISNDKVVTTVPNSFEKIIVNRLPLNNSIIKHNASSINDISPKGTLRLYYKNIKFIGQSNKNYLAFAHDSCFALNFNNYQDLKISLNAKNNIVQLSINDGMIYSGFYTEQSLDTLTLDSNKDLAGLYFGSFSDEILSEIELYSITGNLTNRYNLNDIYIGKDGYNPVKIPFSISIEDAPKTAIGLPIGYNTGEGIFIGYDELCESPLSSDIGQWIFRTRIPETENIPIDVIVYSYNLYSNQTETKNIEHITSGYVLTDGEFSDVSKSSRNETDELCHVGLVCENTYRFCGNNLLETDGWIKLEESNSDLINTIVGGYETSHKTWLKIGEFDTSNSNGIYRVGPSNETTESQLYSGNSFITEIPCDNGKIEYKISLRTIKYDTILSNAGFNYTGIVPINLVNDSFNFKLSLGFSSVGQPLIFMLDGSNNEVLDLISYGWADQNFHEYLISVNYETYDIKIYVDNYFVSKLSITDFQEVYNTYNNNFIGFHLLDSTLLNENEFYNNGSSNILDIDLINFYGFYEDGESTLESDDILINTDKRLDFEFHTGTDGYDGYYYQDEYGYEGYGSVIYDVDEVLFSSDKLRYIVDSGQEDTSQRFSIFKDGKGFLNFRIYDNSLKTKNETGLYNIATNIKNFKAGESHQIAASWKLNSIDERDEMHLFIDGQEVPNIYKFGGKVPLILNEKYSDISKETLQNFLVKDIVYPNKYTDGTVSAASTSFFSDSLYFDESYLGRSVIIYNSEIAPTYIGQEYIIKSVSGGGATFGRGSDLTTVTFDTSAHDIEFSLAPYTENILTDLKNSRFIIFRTNSLEELEEFGGILYSVSGSSITILNNNIINPKYRANITNKIIEFIGKDNNCLYLDSVDPADIDIHIETFGLNTEFCKEKFDLSSSSYHNEDSKFLDKSILSLYTKEPIDLSDVKIRKIILDRTVVDINNTHDLETGYFNTTFDITLDSLISKVSSDSGILSKHNYGRYLTLVIDSDNIDFCRNQDGYLDGYEDQNSSYITIYGTTIDGANQETFSINKNGEINGAKLFTSVSSVSGNLIILDPNYFEAGVISIQETNTLDISDNNGEYLEVYGYHNGHFNLTVANSGGTSPFELHPGYYTIEYPSYLRVPIKEVGHNLFIGTDYNEENNFGGVIDNFRIISELSNDTRVTESDTLGTRSVTEDYNSPNQFCPNEITLALLRFNDPKIYQLRRARSSVFLDTNNNIKYKLTSEELDTLSLYFNNESLFIKQMLKFGFDLEQAIKLFVEVQRAESGPIWNLGRYYSNYSNYIISENSLNENFGQSAYFNQENYLLINNDSGHFRSEEGTIEFWVSPLIDTFVDEDIRYYIDISTANKVRVTSSSSRIIKLTNPAKEIYSIKLLTNKKADSSLYTINEKILFDEITRDEITGRLTGGSGSDKDFSLNHILSADGKDIYLDESLPGSKIDVVVTYLPVSSTNDRVSIYKNKYSQLVFQITANGIDNIVSTDINWKKNTWHRVKCLYKTNSNNDFIKIIVDGVDSSYIKYGTNLLYGDGLIFGQHLYEDGGANNINYKIPLSPILRLISIGADNFGFYPINARLDNIRFSRKNRKIAKDSAGNTIDVNYSANTNTVSPVVEDDLTTFIIDFDESGNLIKKFATVIDPKYGIFDFKVEVIDNFDKVININDGQVEDLIVELVNRLKPAHTNAYVKFTKNDC